MSIYKIKGQVSHIKPPHKYNKSGDVKMMVVITVPNNFIKNRLENIPFDFFRDNMGLLAPIHVGDYVEIDWELRGRKWVPEDGDPNFYINLEGVDIKIVDND
jgi:hypothetical protein